jgi:hypothetical protein
LLALLFLPVRALPHGGGHVVEMLTARRMLSARAVALAPRYGHRVLGDLVAAGRDLKRALGESPLSAALTDLSRVGWPGQSPPRFADHRPRV